MIALDAGVLIAHRNAKCPEDTRIRAEALIARATKLGQRIILPSPAVAEYLAGMQDAAAAAAAADIINSSRAFRVAAYGERAAMETALILNKIKNKQMRKAEGVTWAKAKFDWQIAAIAKVEGARLIFTTDSDVVRAAGHFGIEGMLIQDMPLPDEARQRAMPF